MKWIKRQFLQLNPCERRARICLFTFFPLGWGLGEKGGKMTGSSADLLTSFWINVVATVGLLIFFALFKNQPLNFRVYFPRWYVHGMDERVEDFVIVSESKKKAGRYVNLSWKSYAHTMDWIWSTLRMTEAELIELVGLDSTVLLRIFLLGLKVFLPMLVWGCVVLMPINQTDNNLHSQYASNSTGENYTNYSKVDTVSIANIQDGSPRLWAHMVSAYLFTAWTCFMLYIEYETVEKMRFEFLASQKQRPDQFTVLARGVPKDETQSVGLQIEEFFRENHEQGYATHQVVYKANKLSTLVKKKQKFECKLDRVFQFMSREPKASRPLVKKRWYDLSGEKVDAVNYYDAQVALLEDQIKAERKNILSDEKCVMRAGFVSFRSRWGAAVCAQTQQSRDQTQWLTEWAPEPRDVYWRNLALPYMMLSFRRLSTWIVVTVLLFLFFIPVAFVQSLVNLDSLNKYLPFLKPIIQKKFMTSFIQGFLPGALLKLCLAILRFVLWGLTKYEGHVSYSKIDKYTALKYYVFMVVSVFFGNVLIGSLFQAFKQYISAPTTIPKALGNTIPQKATFFMTYILVDGWTSTAAQILRLWQLIRYHFKNLFLVRSEREQMKVIPATAAHYDTLLSRISLYFLLGLVYSVVSPLILPFLCVYFGFGYIVYRNQVINVYEPKYESAGSYWPFVFRNIIIALLIKHITIIGIFSVKQMESSTFFLVPLPFFTIIFFIFCCQKFLPGFKNYPLEEARRKDRLEPNVDVKNFLEMAYLHPSIKMAPTSSDSDDDTELRKNGMTPSGTSGYSTASPQLLPASRPKTKTNANVARSRSGFKDLDDIVVVPRNQPVSNTELGSQLELPNKSHASTGISLYPAANFSTIPEYDGSTIYSPDAGKSSSQRGLLEGYHPSRIISLSKLNEQIDMDRHEESPGVRPTDDRAVLGGPDSVTPLEIKSFLQKEPRKQQ